MKIGVIGLGKMGGTIAELLSQKYQVFGYDIVEKDLNGVIFSREGVFKSDVIICAVKPSDFGKLDLKIGDKIFISVMAGVSSKVLRMVSPNWARVMPSILIREKKGVIGVFSEVEGVKKIVAEIFDGIGKIIFLKNDDEVNLFTVASASSPGYLSVVFESFEDALVNIGIERRLAREISAEVFLGIAELIKKGFSPTHIKEEVMTPAGITASAIKHISEVRKIFFLALEDALKKAKELEELEKKT